MHFHVRFLLGSYALLFVTHASKAAAANTDPESSGPRLSFHVISEEPGGWPELLSSIGLTNGNGSGAAVIVALHGTDVPSSGWAARVEHGAMLVLEGESPLAASFGFRARPQPHLPVRNVEDLRAPDLAIIWEKAVDLPVFEIPAEAHVFARERWQKAPLVAGFRKGTGAVLWAAAPPGPHGYERFPYLPQALLDLGLKPPFRSSRLWAFFDSAYRSRVDLDYFAERWRAAGISGLHVAAWHFWERNPQSDEYMARLIETCHRHAIQVYAWLELPHVSDIFGISIPSGGRKPPCCKTHSSTGASW